MLIKHLDGFFRLRCSIPRSPKRTFLSPIEGLCSILTISFKYPVYFYYRHVCGIYVQYDGVSQTDEPLVFIFPNRLINTFMAHTGNTAQFSSATYLLRTVIIVWTIMYILSNCTRKGNALFFVLDVAYIYDLLSPIYTFHYVGRSCV